MPDTLVFRCSLKPLEVTFEIVGRHYSGRVNCGNLFLAADIPDVPLVSFDSAEADKLYTLMMIDPDGDAHGSWPDSVPPGKNAPVRHWIVGNIPGRVLASGYREQNGETDAEGVQILEPYRYPHIPGVSDRYGLFVFEQPGRIAFESLSTSVVNFDYRAFINKYRLGQPVASNYFVAVYTSVSPFSGKLFHGNDVEGMWHRDLGEGELVP
ncbi:YbhB/YbcL family Raf kinase inhibitor-like protein [Microbulbifer rhizosphaerae]|uniref:Uncharacterized protein n=1 Tax=Microbulbifer rhizosphaerae TaxID=1562603 RepID=A0A7W4Z8K7_9GAMM|nr:YbhB/YbcL family Raf kinase inhibitor-like protein [Microbulbifer rhizosphaerae]MBB3060913.1 hypothetical protein [Microbulbifer rhizosphaerae]